MNMLCDPIMLKFERDVSTGIVVAGELTTRRETVLEADLVELYIGFSESLGSNRFYHEAAKPFAGWIKKHFNLDVSTTQAETIARVVDKEYGEFKKKFETASTLDTSSGLTQEASMSEPFSSSSPNLVE